MRVYTPSLPQATTTRALAISSVGIRTESHVLDALGGRRVLPAAACHSPAKAAGPTRAALSRARCRATVALLTLPKIDVATFAAPPVAIHALDWAAASITAYLK